MKSSGLFVEKCRKLKKIEENKKTEEIAVELLKTGMTSEKIEEILKVSEAEVKKLLKMQ